MAITFAINNFQHPPILYFIRMGKNQQNKKHEKNHRKHEKRRIEYNRHLKELAAYKLFNEATRRILDVLKIPDLFKPVPKKDISDYYSKHVGTVQVIPAGFILKEIM